MSAESNAAKILDDIIPVLPALAQKIPSKVRAALYALAPLAVLFLGDVIPADLAAAISDTLAVLGAGVAVANTPKA